mgnify:CR=1 FL=1|tara:strand:+ start:637 stop:1233 length:597 start_codon:yes stop_codon:yes gene_type:complete
MRRIDASAELIERLLNEFNLAPKARQFVLSLKVWDEDRGLTSKQLEALKNIEFNYTTTKSDNSNNWTEEERKVAIICAQYYKENPPYFSDLSYRLLSDDQFVPSDSEYRKLTQNKYAQKVLQEHETSPLYNKGDLTSIRKPALEPLGLSEYDSVPLIVIKPFAAPIVSAAKGSKRYLVLPVAEETPFLIEERYLKKYR